LIRTITSKIKELKLGQSALLAGSAGIGQAISYIFMPVLSRVFTTEDYSTFSLYYAWIVPLAVFSTFRMEFAIPHQSDSEKRFSTAHLTIKNSIYITLICALILALGYVFGFLSHPEMCIWLPLGILSISIPQILYFLSTRENQYKKSGLYRIINNLVLQSATALLGWMTWGSYGLIIGMLIGQLAGTLTLATGNFKKIIQARSSKTWIQSLHEFKSYILYSTPQGLIETLQLSGTIFVIYALFDEPYPGLFYLCWRILQSPISLISNTIFVVHYNNASQLHNQNEDYQWLIKKTAKLLFAVGAFIGVLLFFLGPWLFALFLGEPWREAGEIARILSLWFVFQFAVTPFSFVAILEKEQRTAFLLSVIDIIVKLLSLVVGCYFQSIKIGLTLYSITSSILLLYTYFWYLKKSKKHS
jgi:O-antigen/teichoic acid export membrane protein